MDVGVGHAVNFRRGECSRYHCVVTTEGMGPRLSQVTDGLKTEERDEVFGCEPEDSSQEEEIFGTALGEYTERCQWRYRVVQMES